MFIHGLKRSLHVVDEEDDFTGNDNPQSNTPSSPFPTVTNALDAITIHRKSIAYLHDDNHNYDNNNHQNNHQNNINDNNNNNNNNRRNSTLHRRKSLTFIIGNDGNGSSLVTTSSIFLPNDNNNDSINDSNKDSNNDHDHVIPSVNYHLAPKFAGWLQIATRGETLGKININVFDDVDNNNNKVMMMMTMIIIKMMKMMIIIITLFYHFQSSSSSLSSPSSLSSLSSSLSSSSSSPSSLSSSLK